MYKGIIKGQGFYFPNNDEVITGKDHEEIAEAIIESKGKMRDFERSPYEAYADYVTYEMGAIKVRNDRWQRVVVVSKDIAKTRYAKEFLDDYEMLEFRIQVLANPYATYA